jgi:hypothetical protein
MMNRFQTLLSNSTCAAIHWSPIFAEAAIVPGMLFPFVVGQCRLTLSNPRWKRLELSA